MSDGTSFQRGQARKVGNGLGLVKLIVSKRQDPIPGSLLMRCAQVQGVIRFAGGTAASTAPGAPSLSTFTEAVFSDRKLKRLALMSGGTRIVNRMMEVNPEVIVEMPGWIRRWNTHCIALGSVPLVATSMSYQGEASSFMLSDILDDTTLPNPDIEILWVVQHDAGHPLDWDGDVVPYLTFMKQLQQMTGAVPALMAWNGGAVTATEIRGALERGFRVLLIEGSGRFTDDAIRFKNGEKVQEPNFRKMLEEWRRAGIRPNFDHIRYDQPEAVKAWLTEQGLRHAQP